MAERMEIMNKRNIIMECLVLVLLTVLVTGFGTGCAEQRGNINGVILDENGNAIAKAIIRAERSGYPAALLRADRNGSFSINNINAGKWSVEFYDANGFPLGLKEITVHDGKTTTLTFTAGKESPPENMPRLINVPE